MADITLQQAQQMVDSWIKTYGVRYFNELTNMTILTEEVGELARIMARTYGEQSFKESDKHRDLGDEMADVLWVLLCLANQTGVDLTAAFEKNLQKKTDRDKERHINFLWNQRKHNGDHRRKQRPDSTNKIHNSSLFFRRKNPSPIGRGEDFSSLFCEAKTPKRCPGANIL